MFGGISAEGDRRTTKGSFELPNRIEINNKNWEEGGDVGAEVRGCWGSGCRLKT